MYNVGIIIFYDATLTLNIKIPEDGVPLKRNRSYSLDTDIRNNQLLKEKFIFAD
jgi:hypothetical protein